MTSKKAVYIYLVTASIFLCIALGLAIYVWHTLQQLGSESTNVPLTESEVRTEASSEDDTTRATSAVKDSDNTNAAEESIVIEKSTLTEGQQQALQTLGVEGDQLVITESMISCAKEALGEERYAEILGGSTPGPLESLSLLGCMRE